MGMKLEAVVVPVADVDRAKGFYQGLGWRLDLAALGAQVSEVFHAGTPGAQFQPDGTGGRVSGPAPDHDSYGSFATFSDPDGNGWLLQAGRNCRRERLRRSYQAWCFIERRSQHGRFVVD